MPLPQIFPLLWESFAANAAPADLSCFVGVIRGFIALGHPVVDSGILPSALRANAKGVIQNRSQRFCRGISTSMYKKTHLRTTAEMGFFAIRY